MRTKGTQGTKGDYVVWWRGFPVLFCQGIEGRRVYSLVGMDGATRFESRRAAVEACVEYNLAVKECGIVAISNFQKKAN